MPHRYHGYNSLSHIEVILTSTKLPSLRVLTLPETNIAPENGWLEYILVSYWDGLFSGAKMLVPEGIFFSNITLPETNSKKHLKPPGG